MKNKFIYFILTLQTFVSARGNSNQANDGKPKFFEDTLRSVYGDVIFSNVVFRHGDRNAVFSFPNDQYETYFLNAGMGQLVKAGKQRAYRLGVWTRARYANLTEAKPYSPKYVKIVSSDVERTINSAQMFLAGFYPPKFDQEIWNEKIPWQPIAVRQIPTFQDNLIGLRVACPRYNMEVVQHLTEAPEIKSFYDDYGTDFFDYIEKNTGLKIPRDKALLAIPPLSALYDTLLVQEQLGLKHPDWAMVVYPEPLHSIQKIYFNILVFNDVTKRLKGGPLINEMVQSMVKKRENYTEYSERIFQIYSGHDSTLATLLHSLDIYDGIPPPYSTALFVELRQKDGNYFVTMIYRNSEDRAPLLLELPNCKYPCTLDAFIRATSPRISSNWQEECNSSDPDYNKILF